MHRLCLIAADKCSVCAVALANETVIGQGNCKGHSTIGAHTGKEGTSFCAYFRTHPIHVCN
eukprot:5548115-Pyramimonas_sp.AAC.1